MSYFHEQPSDLSNSDWVKYILINTLKVYLDNFFTFILISLIPVGIFTILRYLFIPQINELNQNELNGIQLFLFGLIFIVGFFISVLATAALSVKVHSIKIGNKLSVINCYLSVWNKIVSLSIANLVYFVLFFAAVLLSLTIFGLPLLFLLMINFCFFNQMILFENMGPIESFSGSYELVKKFRLRIFFVIVLVLILLLFTYFLIWILGPEFSLINNLMLNIVEVIIFPITGIIPITGITTMLIYLDIKQRKQTNT